jgi:hypothetical protein
MSRDSTTRDLTLADEITPIPGNGIGHTIYAISTNPLYFPW